MVTTVSELRWKRLPKNAPFSTAPLITASQPPGSLCALSNWLNSAFSVALESVFTEAGLMFGVHVSPAKVKIIVLPPAVATSDSVVAVLPAKNVPLTVNP